MCAPFTLAIIYHVMVRCKCESCAWRTDRIEPALQGFDIVGRGLELGLNGGTKERENYAKVKEKNIYLYIAAKDGEN